MNEKEFEQWYIDAPMDLYERFNEIQMPGTLSALPRKILHAFFKEGAWLINVHNPNTGRIAITVLSFNKKTKKWSVVI